ncbi:MAG: DNA-3-methyladenine glycosylase I [Candidatus Marinimicrobia bacterium]|nr:DNA-3-methyladenine glycosylase I [Candidatus Neomarinimicrobiota bacterium]MDD5539404.1 DNA-3-methyladenine glycosylase I [Candidatus Neomarinimicrobiota bacterium]
MTEISRCSWPGNDKLMIAYHDTEWGVPVHDDRKLFEFMVLDAFQAGLSWRTILHKRQNFRRAFADFNIREVARFDEKRYNQLLTDAGIIRNRAKIRATIDNAARFMEIQKEFGSFDRYIWRFTAGQTIVNRWKTLAEIPTRSPEAEAMSADLIQRGFRFVGPTICYAFMQAAGMVNDHLTSCFRWRELQEKLS